MPSLSVNGLVSTKLVGPGKQETLVDLHGLALVEHGHEREFGKAKTPGCKG